MNDLEKSELVIAKILALLLDWGIQKQQLEFHELELDEGCLNHFVSCIDWLEAEGVIRTDKVVRTQKPSETLIINPVLTAYGFRILGKNFASGDQTDLASHAKKISEGKTSMSSVGDFIGSLLGGYTKSVLS